MFTHPEESTAYVSYDAGIMAEMAGCLEKEEQQKRILESSSYAFQVEEK